jgi:hypothetical protein
MSISSINVSGATASKYAYFDANKNLVAVNDPSTNLLSSNNTWSGLNSFTNAVDISPRLYIDHGALGDKKLILWDGTLSATDWYGFGIQAYQMRYNVGNNLANHDFLCANSTLLMRITGGGVVNIPSLTASKLLLSDGSKNVVSGSFAESEIVRTSTNQTIAGDKVFVNNPLIQNSSAWSTVNIVAGSSGWDRAHLYMQSFGGSGNAITMLVDSGTCNLFNNSTGRTIWAVPKSTDIVEFPQGINLSAQTASRMLATDARKNVVTTSFGSSEVVITSTNQSIAGEKTFSTGIKLPTSGGTPSLLNFYEEWSDVFTFTNIFSVNQIALVKLVRVGTMITMVVSGTLATASGSSSATCVSTGSVVIPSRFRPSTSTHCGICNAINNSASTPARIQVSTGGVITITVISTTWGTSGSNGFEASSGCWVY